MFGDSSPWPVTTAKPYERQQWPWPAPKCPSQAEVRAQAYELATKELDGGPVEAVIDRAERIFDWLWTGKKPGADA